MLRKLLLLLAVAVAAWYFWPKGPQLPPEQAVAAVIDALQQAADKKDAGAIIERLSKRFEGPNLDRQQAKGMILMQLQRGGWSRVFIVHENIRAVSETTVEASFQAVLARGGNPQSLADIAPDAAGAYGFDLTFELEDGEWMIVRGAYRRVQLRDLLPGR